MKTTLGVLKTHFVQLYHSRWFNKYTISLLVFTVWMCFFDKHNMITQWQLKTSVNRLEHEIEDYQELLEKAKKDKAFLDSDQERFAREKYFMHRPDEEIFIMEQ